MVHLKYSCQCETCECLIAMQLHNVTCLCPEWSICNCDIVLHRPLVVKQFPRLCLQHTKLTMTKQISSHFLDDAFDSWKGVVFSFVHDVSIQIWGCSQIASWGLQIGKSRIVTMSLKEGGYTPHLTCRLHMPAVECDVFFYSLYRLRKIRNLYSSRMCCFIDLISTTKFICTFDGD